MGVYSIFIKMGCIMVNQRGGIKAINIDIGYPNGNLGLSSKLSKIWYFFGSVFCPLRCTTTGAGFGFCAEFAPDLKESETATRGHLDDRSSHCSSTSTRLPSVERISSLGDMS